MGPKRRRAGEESTPPSSSIVPILPSELDLFADQHQNQAIVAAEVLALKPVNAISNTNVSHLEFVSSSESHRYRNLSNIYLRLRLRLTQPDGSALEKDKAASAQVAAVVAPKFAIVNNGFHSLISSISLYLNGTDVSQASDFYAYRAYIESLLSFSSIHAYERLGPEFYRPSPDHFFDVDNPIDENVWTPDLSKNISLNWRYQQTKDGKVVELYGKLFSDLSTLKCLIPGNVDMRVKINLNEPDFYLLGNTAGKQARIYIDDATLMTQVCTIQPSLLLAHERAFQTRTMAAHFKRTMVKQFVVPGNLRSFSLANCWVGTLPRLVIFAMVDQNAASGDIMKNPMVFKHYSLSSLLFDAGGKQIKIDGMSFSRDQNIYASAFVELYGALNLHRHSHSSISYHDFLHGKFILAADLSATLEGLNHDYAPAQTGSLRVQADFAEPLPNAITVIMMGIFDSTLYIDKNRNVSYSV